MTAVSAARAILRQLNEIMSSAATPQAKLDRVVRLIGVGLDSEVCSIYLLRDGELELFATRGLAQEAVHVTRLQLGEGLVGTIAETCNVLNLAEAWSHPNFVYRPETGEELFHSFAGVPIIRAEQAIGVLCVQHLEPRDYADIEIEALQTVAMVLSELITSAGLAEERSSRTRASSAGPLRLSGLKLVDGLALGRAVFHQPRVVVEHTVAEDVEVERQRVVRAFSVMREQIEQMMKQADFAAPGDHEEILETYKMFAYDEGWARRINEAIDSGLTAEAAIQRVQQRTRDRMRDIQDPFFRERLHDLDDLSNRLLRIVAGKLGTAARSGLREDSILLARNLGPAELLEYDRRHLKGVVLEEGSLTSHVTIVARAMGVCVLGRIPGLRSHVSEGDPLLLDCVNSALVVRPTAHMVKQYQAMSALKARRDAHYATLRDLPAVSRDGERITILINAGLRDDVAGLALTKADGIGLFRTEFQFLVSATLPRRERQTRLYREVLEGAGEKPVIFRSVDIGGDKAVPYVREAVEEENPVLGWRALRLALERKGLLKVQARALLDAAAGRVLNIMFPMVTEPWEFDRAKALVEEERGWLERSGRPLPSAVCYGAMIEVPAIAETLDLLLPKVDFLSIGTNDLLQFLFAADRSNPKLADRYDWLSPAVLRFLKRIVDRADAAAVPLTVCGEMGGRPTECLALLALGIRRISITPAAVGPIKAMIRSARLKPLREQMSRWLAEPRADLRGLLAAAADAEGIVRD